MKNREQLLQKVAERYPRILVTGGAGFIGSHICEALVNAGVFVYCIDDLSGGSRINLKSFAYAPNFVFYEFDITTDSIIAFNIDAVIHLAVLKKTVSSHDPSKTLDVNVNGTLRLLENTPSNARFIHSSTGSVYGELSEDMMDEQHPIKPVSQYGVSKYCAEQYVQYYERIGLSTVILRYFNVIGTRQSHGTYGGVVPKFCHQTINNKPVFIHGDGTQVRSFTDVNDVVNANLLALVDDTMTGGTFNVASEVQVTINDLFEFIKSGTNYGQKPVYAPVLPDDIHDFSPDSSLIRNHGLTFNKDWKSIVKEVLHEKRAIPVYS